MKQVGLVLLAVLVFAMVFPNDAQRLVHVLLLKLEHAIQILEVPIGIVVLVLIAIRVLKGR
jgi:hypothetical protein